MRFGEWIRKIRGQAGATQKAFAAAIGSRTGMTIVAWEKRETPPQGMWNDHREALLSLLGYADEAEMLAACAAGDMPSDMPSIRAVFGRASGSPADVGDGLVGYDDSMTVAQINQLRPLTVQQQRVALGMAWAMLDDDERAKIVSRATRPAAVQGVERRPSAESKSRVRRTPPVVRRPT